MIVAAMSTSLSFSTWLTTSFSTIYHTSISVVATIETSVESQFSTAVRTSSITQAGIVMASTLAVPITVTSTLTNILAGLPASTSAIPSSPASTVTETIVSTITQPYRTLTYYPPSPTTTIQVITEFPVASTVFIATPTITVTEIIFYLENGSGNVYSTITTTLPVQTSPIVIVPGYEEDHDNGWSSWSDAQKGGLIAGVILAFLVLVLLGLFLLWCLRRKSVWVAGEWETNPSIAVQQPGALVIPQSYWQGGHSWRI